MLRLTAALVLCSASLAFAAPSPVKSSQRAHSTSIRAKINYLTFLPKSYQAKGEKVPLIVFLHGSGERGADLDKVKA